MIVTTVESQIGDWMKVHSICYQHIMMAGAENVKTNEFTNEKNE